MYGTTRRTLTERLPAPQWAPHPPQSHNAHRGPYAGRPYRFLGFWARFGLHSGAPNVLPLGFRCYNVGRMARTAEVPGKPATVRVTFRVNESMKAHLEEASAAQGLSTGAYLRGLIRAQALKERRRG